MDSLQILASHMIFIDKSMSILTCHLHFLPCDTFIFLTLWTCIIGTQETVPARTFCICGRRTFLSIFCRTKRNPTTGLWVIALFHLDNVTRPPFSWNQTSYQLFQCYLVSIAGIPCICQSCCTYLKSILPHRGCRQLAGTVCRTFSNTVL